MSAGPLYFLLQIVTRIITNYLLFEITIKIKNAEMLLYKRRPDDAISVLLQARPPLTYRAIKTNIRLFRWAKALEIALKTGKSEFVDIVLWYKTEYLKDFKRNEDDPIFQNLLEKNYILSRDSFLKLKHKLKVNEETIK